MNTKKKLLIVTQVQFGYHTDPFEFAKGLRKFYEVTFYCWDYGRPKVTLKGVHVIYMSRKSAFVKRNFLFRYHLLKLARQQFDYIFIMYFLGVSLIHLTAGQSSVICDVRTGGVYRFVFKRILFNAILYLELLTFRNKTLISDGLAKRIGIKNYHLLPLGANPVPFEYKSFDKLNIIYVGTLTFRKVEDTVRGFGNFYHKFKDQINCKYVIIGSGIDSELKKIYDAIEEYHLEDNVILKGYIQHDKLDPYLQEANIGISYIPITDYFDCQPPTKTYEYLLSGMAVLATATKENRFVINENNGILIKDTPEAVAEGLEALYKNRFKYNASSIQDDARKYSWKNIVKYNLNNYLNCINKKDEKSEISINY